MHHILYTPKTSVQTVRPSPRNCPNDNAWAWGYCLTQLKLYRPRLVDRDRPIYSKPRLSRIQVDWGILSELRKNPTAAEDSKLQMQAQG